MDVTGVEIDESIANIYSDLYPNDKVIVTDAHEYLLNNYKDYDFIWSSPPCPTHSVTNHFLNAQGVVRYPDMNLYQEIILLQTFHKGLYCVENVKSYYDPLIQPQISGRHYFWANFKIFNIEVESTIGRFGPTKKGRTEGKNLYKLGFDLSDYQYKNKNKLLNNCVNPNLGLHVMQCATNSLPPMQEGLFGT